MRFLTRDKASDYLNGEGVTVKGDGLKDHATRGTGPSYTIVNGRALYTREDLDAWVAAQMARPVLKRRRRSSATPEQNAA